MIKDKLNNDNLKDINGGFEEIKDPINNFNDMNLNIIKKGIDSDTNLKGLINAIHESIYFNQSKKEELLKDLDSGLDSSVREKIYELAKKDSYITTELFLYYTKK